MFNRKIILSVSLLTVTIIGVGKFKGDNLRAFDSVDKFSYNPFEIVNSVKVNIIPDDLPSETLPSTEYEIKETGEQGEVFYTTSRPPGLGSSDVGSVEDYSPTLSGNPWYTFDHIGYKDTAFSGERHVAYFPEQGGVHFFGYDSEPLTDAMILKHNKTSNQTISLLQAPVRADWHTLDGNGILFGIETSGLTGEPRDINLNKGSSNVSVSGYSAVATQDKIEIREIVNTPVENMGSNYNVIFETDKECPAVDFDINIVGSKATVKLSGEELHSFDMKTKGRDTGIIVTYARHGCPSLSSVFTYSHVVNGVDYLNPTNTKNGK